MICCELCWYALIDGAVVVVVGISIVAGTCEVVAVVGVVAADIFVGVGVILMLLLLLLLCVLVLAPLLRLLLSVRVFACILWLTYFA